MLTRSPYHLVSLSPWPIFGALSSLFIAEGLTAWFNCDSLLTACLGLLLMGAVMFNWWRDISREASMQGHHTSYVMRGLQWGVLLFIASEILFFFAFFWAFLHSSLAPSSEIGCVWPPRHISPIDPFSIPLLNTAILLSSGVTVTWAHHSMLSSAKPQYTLSMAITILLGFYFSSLQMMEYSEAPFTISDSAYGSTFFVTTGFHGLHVLIGSTILAVCLARSITDQFSTHHHLGFEAGAWYWHFVDVIWIFLYLSMYWWGS